MVGIDALTDPKIQSSCAQYLTGPLKKTDAQVLVEVVHRGPTHQYRITMNLFGTSSEAYNSKVGRSLKRLQKYQLIEIIKDVWSTNPATGKPIHTVKHTVKGRTMVEHVLDADDFVKKVGLTHKGNVVSCALIEMKEMDNKIVVVHLDEASPYPGSWCLPGGLCKYEEKPIECLKRRIKKTIDVDIEVEKKKRPIYDDLSNSSIYRYLPVRVVVYKTHIISGTPYVVEGKEQYAMENGETVKIKKEINDVQYWTPEEIIFNSDTLESVKSCILKYYKDQIKI